MEQNPSATNNLASQKQPQQVWKLLLGIFIGIVFLLGFFLVLDHFNVISLHKVLPLGNNLFSPALPSSPDQKIIAKIGEENLYQKDLDTEMHYYPLKNKADTKQVLLKKMEKDSIILQAAQQEGLIQLNASIFNAPGKDYLARMKKITEITNTISQRQDKIKGSFVSIWFYNNAKPTTMDQTAAKQLALTKITAVYDLVKAKKITMQQAGERLKADTSLAQIDIAYKSNAIRDFAVAPSERITFDKNFDDKIKQLQPGQLTDLYLAKDKELKTKRIIDAMYMFAQVSSRSNTGNTSTFDDWYAKKEKLYAISTY